MGIVYFSNEFPREDLQTLFRHLHNHSKVKKHASLERFVHEATSAVKDEIRDLPADLQRLIPTFETVTSWAGDSTLREGRLCGAIDGVLLTVLQLAIYIGYIENYADDFSSAKKKTLSALGVGLLSSAALSASSSIDDLVLLGVDVVRTAFRMGIHVFNVSSNLLPVDHENTPESWAYVVHNADSDVAQRDIDAFNTSEQISNTGKVFISAISRTAITISGPPSSLKSILNKCEYLRELKYISLPVFGGLCHAPHMYNQADVARILDSDKLNAKSGAYPVVRALRSTSSGIPFNAKNASDMLHAVVFELLTKTISWDSVVQNLVAEVTSDGLSCSTVQCFCNSMPLNDLRNVLEETTTVTTENLVSWVLQAQSPDSKVNGTRQSKLAIVGMACRLPGGANNTEKFWEILAQGLDVSRLIPPDRFDIETHYDPTGKDTNKTMTQYGCFIDEPGLFDAPFFNMSPREAQVVDPQMRLSLVTAYEALERAGYVANRTHSTKTERIGTFYGQAADDYREVNQGQEVSTYYIPGGCRAFGPGRINYFFKFAGPSYSIDTACSSGLAAIEIACQSLWNGEVDMAVTGGVNVLTNPDGFTGLNKGHFLTKGHNACKTWDAGADGYCRADGVGSLILKRLEDAQADNDRVLGVILGAGTNHSAEAVSITHPHAGHQAYLARQVLRQAGVDPLDISYVELHGTGTQAGDSEEMQGIKDVYAPLVKRRRSDQPLHIGAVKANVGHGESVAGTTALLKVLLMLEKEAIPPHVGIKTQLNPGLGKDLEKRGMHIPAKMTPWLRDASKKRVVAINNFGAAGGNTTVILEEAPALPERQLDPRESHVVAVSAKTRASLSGNIERLLAYLEANPGIELSDLAYTTTARRYHHSFRVATAATNGAQLQKLLRSQLDHVEMIKPVGKLDQPQVAFTFTGQGAAHKSMNLELFHYSPVFQQEILNLDTIAQRQGFPSIVPALDGSFPKDHAHSPVVTQLALLCSQIALTKYWATLGVRPDIVLGHSLGEYAALHVAGVLSANDAIFLVGKRAEQLQQQCTIGSHAMLAVRASLSQIADSAAGKKYTIACINGPFDTVLSGTVSEMDDVTQPLEKAGFRCIKLDVAFAFHSKQTEPILDAFENLATTGVIFHEPKLPFVSPLCGKVVFDGKTLNARYVRRATRETVDFRSALEQAEATGAVNEETLWIEIGPHPVCTAFVKSSLPSAALAVPSMRRGEDNWKTMSDSMAALYLSGIAVDWHEFHRPFEQRLRLLDLPTYAFNDKKHWIQYEGTWCLTKGNTYYSNKDSNPVAGPAPASPAVNDFHTSTVQTITAERIDGNSGSVTMCSNLMQPDLLAAAHGHRMNECGVVTSSIHADIAYTLGKYLFYKFYPKSEKLAMNMTDLVVTKGLVAQKKSKTPQLFSVTAQTVDIESGIVDLTWANIAGPGVTPSEPFATAKLVFEDSQKWLSSWIPVVHLIRGRIEALEALAIAGKADRFSRNMAYRIFADRLVEYADKYRGMQSVVMHELEGFADVQLTTKESGVWTLPPYFIDSVAHLAGFIMNCSDAMDTKEKFCVTPGWDSMRFAKPLLPGARYRSYVKMIPTADDATVYLGDVYIIQDDAIIGMVGAIKFRQYPRVLMNRFFSPPDLGSSNTEDVKPSQKSATHISAPSQHAIQPQVINRPLPLPVNLPRATPGLPKKVLATQLAAEIAMTADSAPPAVLGVAMKALEIIASEGGLDVADLADDAAFADLGIDSLMSLVLAEKFKSQLNVNVNGSLFLDYPTIGDLRKWLEECY